MGKTYGIAMVTEDGLTPGATIDDVAVFFRRDDANIHQPDVNNWFFYWQQIPLIKDKLTLDGLYLYDINNCKFDDHPTPYEIPLIFDGSITGGVGAITNVPWLKMETPLPKGCILQNDNKKVQKVVTANAFNNKLIKIQVGPLAGEEFSNFCNPAETKLYGIHAFYNTVVHEIEHVKLKFEIWNFTHPSEPEVIAGYNDNWDLDRDYYKDVWEKYGNHPSYNFTDKFQDDNYNGI